MTSAKQPSFGTTSKAPPPMPFVNPLGFTAPMNPNDVPPVPVAPFPGRMDTPLIPGGAVNPSADKLAPSADQPAAVPAAMPAADTPLTGGMPSGPSTFTLTDTKSTFNTVDSKLAKEWEAKELAAIKAGKAKLIAEAAEEAAKAGDAQLRANEYQRVLQQEADAEAAKQSALAARQKEVDGAVSEFTAMKIEPNRMWQNMSTGNSLLAGLSMALGAIGAGASGRENTALSVMDKAIDRDIDAQKANMEKAGQNVNMRRTLYQDLRQKFADDAIARAAMKEITFAKLAEEAAVRGANAQSGIIKANAEALEKAAQAKVSEAKLERTKRTEEVMKKQEVMKPAGGIDASKAPLDLFSSEEAKELALVTGGIKGAQSLRTMLQDPQVMDEMGPIDNFINNAKTTWGFEVPDDVVKAAQQGNLVAKAYLMSMSGMGVTDKERENTLKEILPGLNQNPKVAMARVDNFIDNQYRTFDERSAGIIARKGYDPRVIGAVSAMRVKDPRGVRQKYEGKK